MKIGLVLSSPPGYSETFFRSKIKGLQANGYEVVLITAPPQKGLTDVHIAYHPTVSKMFGYSCFRVLWVGGTLFHIFLGTSLYPAWNARQGPLLKRVD